MSERIYTNCVCVTLSWEGLRSYAFLQIACCLEAEVILWLGILINFVYSEDMLQEGGPLPGPETGLLSNTWKWIVWGDTCSDKVRDFIGKQCPGGEQ